MDKTALALHLRKYWQRATTSFDDADWPMAAFFGITLIEEVGKSRLLFDAELGAQIDRRTFRNHEAKYAFAVFTTLYVNSRVTRIYSNDEARFARWFRDGELFVIRSRALYAEWLNDHLVLPHEAIARNDAFLLTCISGEALAEVQGVMIGTGPNEWQETIDEVDAFRHRHESQSSGDTN